MPEMKAPEFVVMRVPLPGDERFVVVETATMSSTFTDCYLQYSTTAERLGAMEERLKALPLLSESSVRVHLADRGLPPALIDRDLERARRADAVHTSAPTLLERITRIGYCNQDGQEVVRKTGRTGFGNQRVFGMRCRACGHEYGVYGRDTHTSRCPACQNGPPGLQM